MIGVEGVGRTAESAVADYGRELGEWLSAMEVLRRPVPPTDQPVDVQVDEWIQSDAIIGIGESLPDFEADHRPMGEGELLSSLHLLGALRGRITSPLRRVSDEFLASIPAGEANLQKLLDELAHGQWWALTRLGASSLGDVPETTMARLDTAMALVVQRLTNLPNPEAFQGLEIEGRFWSLRTVMRQLLVIEWSTGQAVLQSLQRAGTKK